VVWEGAQDIVFNERWRSRKDPKTGLDSGDGLRYKGRMIALLFAVPWVVGILWICSRGGWSLLWSPGAPELESQASRLRAFRAG
jgi:hypothetical protein